MRYARAARHDLPQGARAIAGGQPRWNLREAGELSPARQARPFGAGKNAFEKGFDAMLKWIVVLLLIAAIASLLGFGSLAGVAAGLAKILIFVVLIGILLLILFGVLVF